MLPAIDRSLAGLLLDELARQEVENRTGLEVTATARDDGSLAVRTGGGSTYMAGLVLLGVGVEPNRARPRGLASPSGVRGAIRVDREMRTSAADVFAAGDCAKPIGTDSSSCPRTCLLALPRTSRAASPGDELTHSIIQRVNATFVTPLDGEDIVGLAARLHDVTDDCSTSPRCRALQGPRDPTARDRASEGSGRCLRGVGRHARRLQKAGPA